jgi:hypothetical protein
VGSFPLSAEHSRADIEDGGDDVTTVDTIRKRLESEREQAEIDHRCEDSILYGAAAAGREALMAELLRLPDEELEAKVRAERTRIEAVVETATPSAGWFSLRTKLEALERVLA